MNRTDLLLMWFVGACAAGYAATILALLGSSHAVPVAVGASIVIYLGHLEFRRGRDRPPKRPIRAAALAVLIESSRLVVSGVLGAVSTAAIVLYFLRWQDRSDYTAHSALLIAPLAYYSYACAKLVARSG